MSDITATGGNIWKPQERTAPVLPNTSTPLTKTQYKKNIVINFLIVAFFIILTFIVQNAWVASYKPNVVEGNTFTATEVSFIWDFAITFCYIAVIMTSSLAIIAAANDNPSRKININSTLIAVIVALPVIFVGVFTIVTYVPGESKLGTTYTEWLAEDVEVEGAEPLMPPSASDAVSGEKAVYEGVDGTTVLVERDSSKVVFGGPVTYTKEILPSALDSSDK